MVARAESRDFTAGQLRVLARAAIDEIWHESRKVVTSRRGIEKPAKKGGRRVSTDDALNAYASGLTDAGELRGLLVDVLFASLRMGRLGAYGGDRPRLPDVAKTFRVDAGKIRQQARADVDRYLKAAEARRAKSKAPAKKKAPRKKGAGRKAPRAKATGRKRRSR